MPIYEYVCEKCGSQIEAIQKVSDPPLKRCQNCRGKLNKVVSRTSFQLKGGGWYASDYARKSSSTDKTDKSADKKPETDKSADKKLESASSSDAK